MNGPVTGTDPPVAGTEALLIVKNAFNCNGSPYGSNCRVSRRAPKKRSKYGTPARVTYTFVCCFFGRHLAELGGLPTPKFPFFGLGLPQDIN